MKKSFRNLVFIFVLMLGIFVPATLVHAEDYDYEDGDYTYDVYSDWETDEEYAAITSYEGSRNVTTLVIPDTVDGLPVKELGYEAFMDLTKLTKVTLPETVYSICDNCFDGCTSLKTINIQSDAEYEIGVDAFKDTIWYNNLLKKYAGKPVVIGTSVVDMNNASGEVTIPSGVTRICWAAGECYLNEKTYSYDTDITKFTIAASVNYLGAMEYVLADSDDLVSVVVKSGNDIYYSKSGVLYSKEESWDKEGEYTHTLLVYPAKKTATSFTVPSDVDVVYNVHNTNLKTVTFAGKDVALVGEAFSGCTNLSSVTLTEGVYLGNSVFKGTAITSLKLPKNCDINIDSAGTAFTGMSKLKTITVDSSHKYLSVKSGALYFDDGDWNCLVCYPAARTGNSLIVKSGTTSVYSIDEARNLDTLVVPTSVTAIYGTRSTLKNLSTIQYTGTSTKWKKVYFGNPSKGKYSVDNIYYNCKSLSNTKITIPKLTYTYTGSAIKPTVTVKYDGSKVSSSYYTVSYKNNKSTGKATITITGKGKYYGTVTKTFKIVPKKITNVTVKSTTKNQMKVSWTKNSTATGYAIQYATNSGFTKNVKTVHVTSNATVSRTIKSLTSGKTYYVRVQGYKVIDGKRCYGSYSTTKTIKVK